MTPAPKPKAMIATLRAVIGLPPPNRAGSRAISQVWAYCKAVGTLSIGTVADDEVEVSTAANNLSLVLGAHAKITLDGSELGLFDGSETINSPALIAYGQCRTALAAEWATFLITITTPFATARGTNTKILDYLTQLGFGAASQYGVRVLDLGGGYHATFSVFPNNDADEVLTTVTRLCQAGNMHVTRELHGAAHPKNPHYYHNGMFSWNEGKEAYEEEEESIRTTLRNSRADVLRISAQLLVEHETKLKSKKK